MKPIKKAIILKEPVLSNEQKLVRKLFLADKRLLSIDIEIKKCHSDLIKANKKLDFQTHENDVREAELLNVNKKLNSKAKVQQVKSTELNRINSKLKIAEKKLKEFLKELAEVKYITSHKVRQPIANILGFSNIIDETMISSDELKLSLNCIKESAIALDIFTKELTEYISKIGQKDDLKKE